MNKLIRNAIQTPDGTIIQSHHRHDYVTHEDAKTGKTYIVDGGLDYMRMSSHEDQIILALYDDEPHSVQREVLMWGTYGPEGKGPFKRVKIADMSDGHLEAVLEECNPQVQLRRCMAKELENRRKSLL